MREEVLYVFLFLSALKRILEGVGLISVYERVRVLVLGVFICSYPVICLHIVG